MADLLSYLKDVGKNDIIFAYKGEINTQLLRSIVQSADAKMDEFGENLGFRKRVSGVLIEILQNVMRHGSNTKIGDLEYYPVMIIARHNDEYIIGTGNLITHQEKEFLENHINKVNSLNAEQLKEFYQEVLKNGAISSKGGAGLGIIDVARKAKDNRINYDFKEINNDYMFFSMFVSVQKPTRKS